MSILAIRADERVQNVYFTEDTISVDMQHATACKRRLDAT